MSDTIYRDFDRVVVRPRTDGKWMWEYLTAGNSETMATDGSQGYENFADCRNGAFRVTGTLVNEEGILLPAPPRQGAGGAWIFPIRQP